MTTQIIFACHSDGKRWGPFPTTAPEAAWTACPQCGGRLNYVYVQAGQSTTPARGITSGAPVSGS